MVEIILRISSAITAVNVRHKSVVDLKHGLIGRRINIRRRPPRLSRNEVPRIVGDAFPFEKVAVPEGYREIFGSIVIQQLSTSQ